MKARIVVIGREGLRYLGWPGVVAIGLSCFSLAFYFSALIPLQSRMSELRDLSHERAEVARSIQEMQSISNKSPEYQLMRFYENFPRQDTAPEWLERVYAAGNKNGLALAKGEYLLTSEKSGMLVKYQITLPIKGTYPQLRRFISAVLQEIPAATLEELRFQRQRVADTTVEAELHLNIYMRPAS